MDISCAAANLGATIAATPTRNLVPDRTEPRLSAGDRDEIVVGRIQDFPRTRTLIT